MSPFYSYFCIRFDENFGQKLPKQQVINVLQKTNRLRQTTHQMFCNVEDFPWLEMILVETYDGNYHSSHYENQFVTLIDIVCSPKESLSVYSELFKEIATALRWRLYYEDDGVYAEIKG